MGEHADKGLIVAGGYAPSKGLMRKCIDRADVVIAADRGLAHLLDHGFIPQVVIGDYDSVDKALLTSQPLENTLRIDLPIIKDSTDLESALDYCLENSLWDIEVLAALRGDRLDHLLGTMLLLPKYWEKGLRVRLLDEDGRSVQLVNESVELAGKPGTFVSLIPLTPVVTGITTKGLRYALDNGSLYWGSTRGISNQLQECQASIKVKEGLLIVAQENETTKAPLWP